MAMTSVVSNSDEIEQLAITSTFDNRGSCGRSPVACRLTRTEPGI